MPKLYQYEFGGKGWRTGGEERERGREWGRWKGRRGELLSSGIHFAFEEAGKLFLRVAVFFWGTTWYHQELVIEVCTKVHLFALNPSPMEVTKVLILQIFLQCTAERWRLTDSVDSVSRHYVWAQVRLKNRCKSSTESETSTPSPLPYCACVCVDLSGILSTQIKSLAVHTPLLPQFGC